MQIYRADINKYDPSTCISASLEVLRGQSHVVFEVHFIALFGPLPSGIHTAARAYSEIAGGFGAFVFLGALKVIKSKLRYIFPPISLRARGSEQKRN